MAVTYRTILTNENYRVGFDIPSGLPQILINGDSNSEVRITLTRGASIALFMLLQRQQATLNPTPEEIEEARQLIV